MFSVVEKNEKAVLLKDNEPAYIALKYDIAQAIDTSRRNMNLKKVLLETTF